LFRNKARTFPSEIKKNASESDKNAGICGLEDKIAQKCVFQHEPPQKKKAGVGQTE